MDKNEQARLLNDLKRFEEAKEQNKGVLSGANLERVNSEIERDVEKIKAKIEASLAEEEKPSVDANSDEPTFDLKHIKGIGNKYNQKLNDYFKKRGISSQEEVMSHLNSKDFHNSDVHNGVKKAVSNHFSETVKETVHQVSNAINFVSPMMGPEGMAVGALANNVSKNIENQEIKQSNRAFKKEMNKELKNKSKLIQQEEQEEIKLRREEEKKRLNEIKEDGTRSADERLGAFRKLKEVEKEENSEKLHKKALSLAGKGALVAGKGALKFGKGALNVGSNALSSASDGLKNKWSALANSLTPSGDVKNIGLLFIGAVVIHILDWSRGFLRTRVIVDDPVFWIYFIFTLFAMFFVYKSSFLESKKFILISIIAFFLPLITNFFQQDFLQAVLLASPIWVIYLMLNPEGSRPVEVIGKIYITGWIILGIISLTSSLVLPSTMGGGKINPLDGWNYLVEIAGAPIKKAWTGISTIPKRLEQTINQTIGSAYYTGQVEQGQNEPVGIYLKDVRPSAPVFFEGLPVSVWATIQGKSFQGRILVESACFADNGVYGKIDPSEPLEIFYEEQNTLGCRFENGFPEGAHQVSFLSTFNFETWGYLTQTFVDRETYMSFSQNNKNINSELDINKKAEPIYTNGPIGIGMIDLDQPIVVDLKNPKGLPAFGVTLENRWPQGKIERVELFEIRTPKEIKLINCDKQPTRDSPRIEEEFNVYEFKVTDPREYFTSVTCRMSLQDENTASQFLGKGQKNIKTFVVIAKYIYTVQEYTNINVEK
ncbi:MAG: hypothetical protein ABIC91_02915 [Nanoarchaeota archaeon]